MRTVVWTEAARADLRVLLAHIAQRNPDASEVLRDRLESPATGSPAPWAWRQGRRPDAREMVVHPDYILVYPGEEGLVRIVNVLHTRRQYP